MREIAVNGVGCELLRLTAVVDPDSVDKVFPGNRSLDSRCMWVLLEVMGSAADRA